jgi:hypothetical protein
LLDIHPEPEHARVQIWCGEEIYDIGHVDDTAIIRDIHGGRAAVEALIREGLFLREAQMLFENVVHVSDADTWLAYREARSSRSFLDPAIIQRARELLRAADGEIRVSDRAYAARYKKA